MTIVKTVALSALTALLIAPTSVVAEDWSMWGRTATRNMESPETGISHDFNPGEMMPDSEEIDPDSTEGVKWVAKVGSQTYGNTSVHNGIVLIGTNNEAPRDERHVGDRGVVKAFDEETGEFLWQLVIPKLGAGKVSDWEFLGICSSPAMEGDVAYVVTNRCEVVAIDLNAFDDGNDGPFTDEGQYMAGPGNPPMEIGELDADILWVYDMREELGVFPHNIASSSILIHGDNLFVTTSNGQDWSHLNIPSPLAPAMIVLDKTTGELVGEEAAGISQRLMHCNWSSPAFGVVDGNEKVFFGAGDGYMYAFDPNPVEDEEGFMILNEYWRYDATKDYRFDESGEPIKYPAYEGPSEIIGTPVLYKDRIYVAIGQDPEHGEGVGKLSCIDANGTGDITESGAIWTYKDIHRTISTVAIYNNLVFAADYTGRMHCVDADTGEVYWVHDTLSHIWGSPLAVDGKVYLGNEDGILTVYEASKELNVMNEIEFPAPIYSSPIVANGILYIASQTHLYAVGE